jgi:endonuclease I
MEEDSRLFPLLSQELSNRIARNLNLPETPPQTSKDAPRAFYLSKEDIDLIEDCSGAWLDQYCGHRSEWKTHKGISDLLVKLGRKGF